MELSDALLQKIIKRKKKKSGIFFGKDHTDGGTMSL